MPFQVKTNFCIFKRFLVIVCFFVSTFRFSGIWLHFHQRVITLVLYVSVIHASYLLAPNKVQVITQRWESTALCFTDAHSSLPFSAHAANKLALYRHPVTNIAFEYHRCIKRRGCEYRSSVYNFWRIKTVHRLTKWIITFDLPFQVR